jgi:RNA polymerase sigma-70 factor (ECF subfamily)
MVSIDDEKHSLNWKAMNPDFSANQVEVKSKKEMVNKAIEMLSPDDAQIITLFYNSNQSLDEIGKIMRMEPNTVKVRLFRARQRLKDKMEKYFSEEVINLQTA